MLVFIVFVGFWR